MQLYQNFFRYKSIDTLEPYISSDTLDHHFNKHFMGYVAKYNAAVQNSADHHQSSLHDNLMKISGEIRNGDSTNINLFNNGGQIWNHQFYWSGMKAVKQNEVPEEAIDRNLLRLFDDNKDIFRQKFIESGMQCFGSGWLWIVLIKDVNNNNVIDLVSTSNADSPYFYTRDTYSLMHKEHVSKCDPLLVCDVWEHSYYLDYQHNRKKYLETFFDHLLDWNSVMNNIRKCESNICQCKSLTAFPDIHLAGIKTTIDLSDMNACSKSIKAQWNKFEGLYKEIPYKTSSELTYGVYTDYSCESARMTFFLGEEVSAFDNIDPNKFEVMTIPRQSYAKFDLGKVDCESVEKRTVDAWCVIWNMQPRELGGDRAWIADFEMYKSPFKVKEGEKYDLQVYIGLTPNDKQ